MAFQPVTELEAQILSTPTISVKDKDGKVTVYTLVLDYNAVVKVQKEIGKDLSVTKNWMGLNGTELSAICWAAFDRHHPEVTLREVRQFLVPAQQDQLFAMLIEAYRPGIIEDTIRWAEQQELEKKVLGETQPDPQPAAV